MRGLIVAIVVLCAPMAQAQFGVPKYLTPWGMWVRPVNTNIAALTIEQPSVNPNTNDLQIVSNGIVVIRLKGGVNQSGFRTNFVDGQLYTNNYGTTIHVSCTISNVISATAGASRHAIWIYPQTGSGSTGATNFAGDYHQAVTATTNLVLLSGTVFAGQVYTFTNQSSAANNDSKIQIGSGTVEIP